LVGTRSVDGYATVSTPAAAESDPTRTEFGADIGGDKSVDALRMMWTALKGRHGALLEGLRPVVAIRETPKGTVEFRLVVGPLANAAGVARLCGNLAAAGVICQPTVFDGQRLAVR
jgi:hypothetical protein